MATYEELVRLTLTEAGVQQELPPAAPLGSGIGMLSDFERWVAKAYHDVQTLHPNWDFSVDIEQVVLQPFKYVYDFNLLIPNYRELVQVSSNFEGLIPLTVVDADGNATNRHLRKIPYRDFEARMASVDRRQDVVLPAGAAVTRGNKIVLSGGSETSPAGVVIKVEPSATDTLVTVLTERGFFQVGDTVTIGVNSYPVTGIEVPSSITGTPLTYAVDDDGLVHLHPVPDDKNLYILHVKYEKDIDSFDVANPQQEAVIPDEYKWVIVYRALMYYYEYATNQAGFAAARSEYLQWVNKMGSYQLPEVGFNPVQLY